MRKTLLIGAFAAAGLAGCASGPYDGYGYGPGYNSYNYDYGYGAPSYYGPNVGFGYYYFDDGGHRRWHDGGRGHDGRRDWEGRGPGTRDRDGRDFRGGESVGGDVRSFHGEMGNEAGMGRSSGGASSGGRGGGQQ